MSTSVISEIGTKTEWKLQITTIGILNSVRLKSAVAWFISQISRIMTRKRDVKNSNSTPGRKEYENKEYEQKAYRTEGLEEVFEIFHLRNQSK